MQDLVSAADVVCGSEVEGGGVRLESKLTDSQ